MPGREGTIYKGIGGFYYVKTDAGELVECKPRGLFRKQGIKPLAGDRVVLQDEAGSAFIAEILPRKNAFVRPPVANVDIVFIVASTQKPSPSFLVLDKLCAVAVDNGADAAVLVTKTDLAGPGPVLNAYAQSGIPAFAVDASTGEGCGRVLEMLNGRLGVFCGNSGVGKSTLLNALAPQAARSTGEISEKLGRGRHTTREVELFEIGGGLLADTPGFASFDLQRAGAIRAENMQFAFPEIKALMPACRFSGCAHLSETGCAVREALAAGNISQSRYDSYAALYSEATAYEKANPSK